MKTSQHTSYETLRLIPNNKDNGSAPAHFNADHIAEASADPEIAGLNFSCSDDWCQITTNEFDLVHFHSPDAA